MLKAYHLQNKLSMRDLYIYLKSLFEKKHIQKKSTFLPYQIGIYYWVCIWNWDSFFDMQIYIECEPVQRQYQTTSFYFIKYLWSLNTVELYKPDHEDCVHI